MNRFVYLLGKKTVMPIITKISTCRALGIKYGFKPDDEMLCCRNVCMPEKIQEAHSSPPWDTTGSDPLCLTFLNYAGKAYVSG